MAKAFWRAVARGPGASPTGGGAGGLGERERAGGGVVTVGAGIMMDVLDVASNSWVVYLRSVLLVYRSLCGGDAWARAGVSPLTGSSAYVTLH